MQLLDEPSVEDHERRASVRRLGEGLDDAPSAGDLGLARCERLVGHSYGLRVYERLAVEAEGPPLLACLYESRLVVKVEVAAFQSAILNVLMPRHEVEFDPAHVAEARSVTRKSTWN